MQDIKSPRLISSMAGSDYIHWGSITLLRRYRDPLMLKDHQGQEYVADSHGGPAMYELECDCGFIWKIEQNKFPGKRYMRNCGREECQYAHPRPKPKKQRETKAAYSLYLSTSVMDLVKETADEKGISFSQAADTLIRQGYIEKLVNE